jgi:hypothetical protein
MATGRPILGAFNQGEIPKIACFNKATIPLGVDFDDLIAAMQEYVDKFVAPIWATPAKLIKSTGFVKGAWAMVFLDDADQPGALAYHDLTPDGLPQSKVFVKTTIDNGDLVSVSASHELVEMLVDPAINLMTTGPDPKLVYAYESADPVEALSFKVEGIPMSDFVYPSYFEEFHKPNSVRFDHPQTEFGALRSDEQGDQAVPDSVWRLSDHLQERKVESGVRQRVEEEKLCEGRPPRSSQRGAERAASTEASRHREDSSGRAEVYRRRLTAVPRS